MALTSQQFINKIAPIIVKEAQARGYKFPSAIIAQACLESCYGRSLLSSKYHNYFGMKCGSSWKGSKAVLKTKEEYVKGKLTTITASFRAYTTMQAGVAGYFDFINAPRYKNLKKATSAANYCELIKACGYATSSRYVDMLKAIIKKFNLTYYDAGTQKQHVEKKSFDKIVNNTIKGIYGNGEERRKKLVALGYDYDKVQEAVNKKLKG